MLTELEWARAVFELNLGIQLPAVRPSLIYLADSPFDFEQFSPSKYAGGFYFGAPWRDLIVLRELLGARHALLHEFTHMVTHHQNARVPAWLGEGLAEYYSTIRRGKEGVEVGGADPRQVAMLRKGVFVPIAYLVTLESGTTLPSHDAVSRFYAQSWLYTHMLHLSPPYRNGLLAFRTLLADGASTEEALRRVYSKTLVQFDNDARAWLAQDRLPTALWRDAPPSGPAVEERVIEEVAVQIVRATVAARRSTSAGAADYARFSKLAQGQCLLQASLGDLAHAAGLYRESVARYQDSLQCGGKGVELARGLAASLSSRAEPLKEERQAIAGLTPDGRTYYLLGAGRFFSQDYAGALQDFEKATGIPQYEQFRLTRMRAIALSNLDRHQEAEQAAEQLAAIAADPDQRHAAQVTIEDARRLRLQAEPPRHPQAARNAILNLYTKLEGELIRVDCMGERARFWVRVGQRTHKVLIADPSEVVTGPEAGAPLEFDCGAQRRKVVIGYQAQPDTANDSDGRIRYIEFPEK